MARGNSYLAAVLGTCALLTGLSAYAELGVCYEESGNVLVYGGSWYGFWSKSADSQTVWVRDASEETESAIWQGTRPFDHLALSPSGGVIALLEHTPQRSPCLVLITTDGTELNRLEGVQKYVWSPDGAQVAYIAGPSDEDYPGFKSTGTWVYSLSSNASTKAYTSGYDLNWAAFDGSLYIWEGSPNQGLVHRYEPRTQELCESEYKGIFFSPDGKYVYRPNYEGTPFRLFLTQTNEEVTEKWPFLAARPERRSPEGWLDEETLVFHSRRANPKTDLLFSLRSGTLKEAPGKTIAYTSDKRHLFVLAPTGIEKVPVAALAEVSPDGADPR